MRFHLDCREYRGAMPCRFHKLDGRACRGCEDYDPIQTRVLVIKLAADGDVLRTTAILPALRRRFSRAHITWVTSPSAVPLLQRNPLIDRILTTADCTATLMLQRFDVTIAPDADLTTATLASLARTRTRVGFVADEHGVAVPVSPASIRWWQMGLDDGIKRANRRTYQDLLYELCGLDGPIARPQFDAGAQARDTIRRRLQPSLAGFDRVVALNTGGGGRWQQKKWTPLGYIGFIQLLRTREPMTAVLLVGGPEERELNATILDATLRDGVVDGGCDNSIEEFAAEIELASVVVTADSLALHLALAMSRPVVVFVGPTSPWELELYRSGEIVSADVPCLACYRQACDKPVTCMELLTPQAVYDATLRVVDGPSARPVSAHLVSEMTRIDA
jgi:ADP-heptose:LPS heptosyltransferase